MAETSKIEWTDATWNPITGCSVVSPGCTNCYAMRLAGGRLRHHPSRAGLTQDSKAGPVWTGEVRLNDDWLDQPLRWRRPRRIFVCAHGDLFHEAVPGEWIDRVFAVMALAPQHQFQVLTKRAGRMWEYLAATNPAPDAPTMQDRLWHIHYAMRALSPGVTRHVKTWPLPHVWLGVSVEDQARADERIPHLLATPAAVRFVSCEPLLGPLDLTEIAIARPDLRASVVIDALKGTGGFGEAPTALDWVIVGGESGHGARPMHPDWARSLRDQCQSAGVAFHFKQWGEWEPGRGFACPDHLPRNGWHHFDPECSMRRVGKRAAGRLLDGREWNEAPK